MQLENESEERKTEVGTLHPTPLRVENRAIQ